MSLFSNLKLDTFYPSSKSHSLCPQIQDIKKTFSSLFRCVYISPMFVIHLRNFVISKSFFHSPLQPSSHPLSSSCYVYSSIYKLKNSTTISVKLKKSSRSRTEYILNFTLSHRFFLSQWWSSSRLNPITSLSHPFIFLPPLLRLIHSFFNCIIMWFSDFPYHNPFSHHHCHWWVFNSRAVLIKLHTKKLMENALGRISDNRARTRERAK